MRWRALAAGSAMALLLVACSSQKTVPTPTGSSPVAAGATVSPSSAVEPADAPLTKAEFVERENENCRAYAADNDALPDPAGPKDNARWLKAFIIINERVQAKSVVLRPPADAAEDFKVYLHGNDQQIALLKRALPVVEKAIRDGDDRGSDAAVRDALDAFNAIADAQDGWPRGYGLKDCVDPQPPAGGTSA